MRNRYILFRKEYGWSLVLAAIASCCLAMAVVSTSAFGKSQAGGESRSSHTPVFDVVSIRPAKDIYRGFQGTRPDEYIANEMPLGETILRAYFPQALGSRERLVGAPNWIWDEGYDFVGKVAASDLTEWQKAVDRSSAMIPNTMLQAMLQAALTERCKLVVHRIPGDVQGYALVLGRHGANWKVLQNPKATTTIPPVSFAIPGGGVMAPHTPGSKPPTIHFFHTSMASLAAWLPVLVGAPVEDKTGLAGNYDYPLVRLDSDADPPDQWDFGALGLKLERIKIATESLMIDHIERPSSN